MLDAATDQKASQAPLSMECPGCKAPNVAMARFCNQCGVDLRPAAPAEPSKPPEAARKSCSGCSRLNAATATFCFHCGAKLPAESAIPAFGQAAGFWIRVLAFLIDVGVLLLVDWALERRLGLPTSFPDNMPLEKQIELGIPSFLLSILTSMIYTTGMVGAWSGTVGKLVLGLRVLRSDGKKLTYGVSLMRWIGEFFSLLPLGLGYLWVALSPSRRAWHDYLCDTRVVYKRPG